MQAYRGLKSNPFSPEERREIAERLAVARRSMRQGKGLLQTEMAELLGVSHSHYSKCESGHNSFSSKFLGRFSERTGVSLEWLLQGVGEMFPQPAFELRETAAGWPAVQPQRPPNEQMVLRVLAAARDPQVVAAAEALAQATGGGYDESVAMVIAKRLAMH